MICSGSSANKENGATLVELVITIVIISVAIAGVVGAFSVITGRSADPLNQTRAVAVAQVYLDEILSRKYDEGTPAGGVPKQSGCTINTEEGSRAGFDDVDDYDSLTDSPPKNADGDALDTSAYSGFSVDVTVTCAGSEIGLANDDAKRIDVVVTDPSNQDYLFSVYRSNF